MPSSLRRIQIALLLAVSAARAQDLRSRYLDLVRSWTDVHFTAAELKAMSDGKQQEALMTKGPDDPLAKQILAAGEPSFDALASRYPGKILDRTVLGTYSDPTIASEYNDEFAIYWNGAIAANLIKTPRPVAHNTVVIFHVGEKREIFGSDRAAFSGMHYADGYLPIVTGTYVSDGVEYRETAFAAQPAGETRGWDIAFVEFAMKNTSRARKTAVLSTEVLQLTGAVDTAELITADPPGLAHTVPLAPNQTARVVFKIPYLPDTQKLLKPPANYDAEYARTRSSWQSLLAKGAQIEVPEERVNNVWRALLLQNFVLADGPRFTYGSGLVYNDSTFPQENGFAALVFAAYGHPDYADALQRNFIGMCVTPQGAGRKYQNRRAMVLHHLLENYRLTGKRDLFDQYRADYYRVADQIIADRHSTMTPVQGEKPLYWGLLPPDKPGADVQASTQTVYVLGHNITNCQGLLDFGRFLVVTGIDPERGNRYVREGADFRATLMDAMRRAAIRLPGRPPFLDLQTLLFRQTRDYGPEPYDDFALGRLQATYSHLWVDMEFHYNFFNPSDDVGGWLADYVQQRNGFVLGCTRSRNESNPRYGHINAVYDAGYYDYRLRRGEVEQFLLGFYGRLAFAMSRNLYVSSEGAPFIGYNTERGGYVGPDQSFPNSASNADTLLMLRNALVLETLENNAETGELVLLSGVPHAWLEPGKQIKVAKLPTYYGPITFNVTAAAHRIAAQIDQPAPRLTIHFRRPLKSVKIDGRRANDADLSKGIVHLTQKHSVVEVAI